MGPFAGVWVDRLDRRRLIVTTQALSMAQSFSLAYFAFTGTITIGHVIVLNLFQGTINAFDMPRAPGVDGRPRREEGKSRPGHCAQFLDVQIWAACLVRASAAFLVAWKGVAFCYLIDGFSYLVFIGTLLAMTFVRLARGPERHPWHDFTEGIAYVRSHARIRTILLLLAIFAVWGIPVLVLAPIFTREILHGQANDLGLVLASEACGAVIGALYLSQRRHDLGTAWRTIVVGGLIQSTGWLVFSQTHWLPLSMLCISIIGFGGILLLASCNTLVQTLVEDRKRGRVMSLYTMAFNGMMPVGYLIEGSLVQRLGVVHTIWVKCAVCFVAIMFFRRWVLRRELGEVPLLLSRDAVVMEPSATGEPAVP